LELLWVLKATELESLCFISPIDLLTLGNIRHCQDKNRAAAIMSALGTTDWYPAFVTSAAQKSDGDAVADFVDGIYPVGFLNEVQTKFGGLFFAAMSQVPADSRDYKFGRRRKKIVGTSLRSTMMPFSRGLSQARTLAIPKFGGNHAKSHASLKSWTINTEGSVHIPEACILACCPRGTSIQDLNARVSASVPRSRVNEPPELFDDIVEVNSWLASFRPGSMKCAVCLARLAVGHVWAVAGVLLERVYSKRAENLFVKMGIFLCHDASITGTWPSMTGRSVDFIVL
jgi:hypothetical protein